MKYLILLFITQTCFSAQTYYDKNGFATCFENNDQVYFIDWDHYTNADIKQVSYFEKTEYIQSTGHYVKNCIDQKYMYDIPNQILKPLADSGDIFPEDILFALNQISVGAEKYRSEKTAPEFIANHQDLFQSNAPTQIESLREDYGDSFATDLVSTWSKNSILPNQSCAKYIGTCDFYLCQEQKSPCGLDGYNLGFGFKYCSGSKFTLFNQMQTDLGKNWVTNVFQCLQKQSLQVSEVKEIRTCEKIKSDAYDSHPDCYVQSGFCELKLSEKLKIFKLVKKEIFSQESLPMVKNLLHKCHIEKQEQDVLNSELN